MPPPKILLNFFRRIKQNEFNLLNGNWKYIRKTFANPPNFGCICETLLRI